MNTLVILLSAVLGQAEEQNVPPQWRQSYGQAQNMAAQIQRPVAVFLTQGPGGMDKLIQGGLSDQAKEILTSDYIPVMVDTTRPEGQRLARDFGLSGGQGLVLSDRSGTYQAFWSQDSLTSEQLLRNLQKYANQTTVRMTEIAGRPSLYGPVDQQGNPVPVLSGPGTEAYPAPAQGQRRLGSRDSGQRMRLFRRSSY
jgi:hypothetical protein